MGRPFLQFVEDDGRKRYCCHACSAEVASSKTLIWEGFMGETQPACLFSSTVNVESYSEQRKEQLSTGNYILIDVRCRACQTPLGWRYLKACSIDNEYKEGGTLLQHKRLQVLHPTDDSQIRACEQ